MYLIPHADYFFVTARRLETIIFVSANFFLHLKIYLSTAAIADIAAIADRTVSSCASVYSCLI